MSSGEPSSVQPSETPLFRREALAAQSSSGLGRPFAPLPLGLFVATTILLCLFATAVMWASTTQIENASLWAWLFNRSSG
jgi:hypothetical protein